MTQKTIAQHLETIVEVIGLVRHTKDGNPSAVTDDQILNALVREHQGLLSSGCIKYVLPFIHEYQTEDDPLDIDPRLQLIAAIAEYHELTNLKNPKATPDQWLLLEQDFSRIVPQDPLMNFLVLNYRFLTNRNGERFDLLEGLYGEAIEAATAIDDEVIRSEHLGYIMYNFARFLIKIGRKDEAKPFLVDAGNQRLSAYMNTRSNVPIIRRLALVQQVTKIRTDWEGLLGEGTLDDCPISEQQYLALKNAYGNEVDDFSLTKKT